MIKKSFLQLTILLILSMALSGCLLSEEEIEEQNRLQHEENERNIEVEQNRVKVTINQFMDDNITNYYSKSLTSDQNCQKGDCPKVEKQKYHNNEACFFCNQGSNVIGKIIKLSTSPLYINEGSSGCVLKKVVHWPFELEIKDISDDYIQAVGIMSSEVEVLEVEEGDCDGRVLNPHKAVYEDEVEFIFTNRDDLNFVDVYKPDTSKQISYDAK